MMLSPVDGRYVKFTNEIKEYFSEYAYIKYRVLVEIKWYLYLNNLLNKKVSKKDQDKVMDIYNNFNLESAKRVKAIEDVTKHDVKAIEYYLREKFEELKTELAPIINNKE